MSRAARTTRSRRFEKKEKYNGPADFGTKVHKKFADGINAGRKEHPNYIAEVSLAKSRQAEEQSVQSGEDVQEPSKRRARTGVNAGPFGLMPLKSPGDQDRVRLRSENREGGVEPSTHDGARPDGAEKLSRHRAYHRDRGEARPEMIVCYRAKSRQGRAPAQLGARYLKLRPANSIRRYRHSRHLITERGRVTKARRNPRNPEWEKR